MFSEPEINKGTALTVFLLQPLYAYFTVKGSAETSFKKSILTWCPRVSGTVSVQTSFHAHSVKVDDSRFKD